MDAYYSNQRHYNSSTTTATAIVVVTHVFTIPLTNTIAAANICTFHQPLYFELLDRNNPDRLFD